MPRKPALCKACEAKTSNERGGARTRDNLIKSQADIVRYAPYLRCFRFYSDTKMTQIVFVIPPRSPMSEDRRVRRQVSYCLSDTV